MKMEAVGFMDLIRKFDGEVQDMERTVKLALQEGGEVLTDVTKEEVKRAANRGYATGELARSIAPTSAQKNRWGYFVAVRPTGVDPRGTRNGAKWGYLKYGNGRGSAPRDFEEKAIQRSEKEIVKVAQDVFERRSKLNK